MVEENNKFNAKAFAKVLFEDIEKNRIKLPTLPTISLEALLVVNDAASSMADVAKVIIKDTSMAARLVRYANSPLYRGINTVTSVKAAITRIGFDAVKNAILSLAMKDVFTTSSSHIQSRMEGLWKHSVEVASKSVVLAGHFRHLNKDEAMLAGLIHDIGIIPILLKAKDYPMLLEKESNLDKVTHMLHMPVGKFLLTHWNFDPILIAVAGLHDKLDRTTTSEKVDYVDIVQVANILSYQGSGKRYDGVDFETLPAFQRVGIELIRSLDEQSGDFDVESELSVMLD